MIQLRGKTTKDDKNRRVKRINNNTDNNIKPIIFDVQGYAVFIDTNHNPIINITMMTYDIERRTRLPFVVVVAVVVVVPVEDTTRVRMI